MRRKVFTLILAITSLFLITAPIITSVQGYTPPIPGQEDSPEFMTLGTTIRWKITSKFMGGDIFPQFIEFFIRGETSTYWIINFLFVDYMSLAEIWIDSSTNILLEKNSSSSVFKTIREGYQFNFWINPAQLTEGMTVTFNNQCFGLHFQPGETLDVESGVIRFNDSTFDVWLLSGYVPSSEVNMYLFYDKSSGLLLRADFINETNDIQQSEITLTSPSISPKSPSNFPTTHFGMEIKWTLEYSTDLDETQHILFPFNIQVFAETPTKLMALTSSTFLFFQEKTRVIDKSTTYGATPFYQTVFGRAWGLWLNTSTASGWSGGVIGVNISGLPQIDLSIFLFMQFWIPGPFNFQHSSSALSIAGKIIDAHYYNGSDTHLYFDSQNGILLHALYQQPYNASVNFLFNLTLSSLSLLGSSDIPGFSISVLVPVFFGIILCVFIKKVVRSKNTLKFFKN